MKLKVLIATIAFGFAAGTVVAEGATEPAGGRHAEVVALEAAGERARGGTLAVTLEPCSHHGRTPPCAEAVIALVRTRYATGEIFVLDGGTTLAL